MSDEARPYRTVSVTYIGRRGWAGATVMRRGPLGIQKLLPLRLDLVNHSPTGPNWGYGGSGPAQLALALLVDATGDEGWALAHYQRFKWAVVAQLPWEWELSRRKVTEWVEAESATDQGAAP